MKKTICLIAIFSLLAGSVVQGKEFTLEKGGPFKLADSIKKTDAIKGYITGLYDDPYVKALAEKCHLLQFKEKAGQGKYTRSDGELKEAAALCGHPEVAHARAILHGVSAQGGLATEEMQKKPDKVIAVIYLHNVNRTNSNGVPILYVAASREGFWPKAIPHHDRVSAWRKTGESTFASFIVHYSQHASNGDWSYIVLWIEEVMKLRVPGNIPLDGSPYDMNAFEESVGYIGDCDAIEIPKGHEDDDFGNQRYINAVVYPYNDYPGGGEKNGDCWLPSKRAADAWAYYCNNLKMPPAGAVIVSENRIRNVSKTPLANIRNSGVSLLRFGLNGRAVSASSQSQNVLISPVRPVHYKKIIPALQQ